MNQKNTYDTLKYVRDVKISSLWSEPLTVDLSSTSVSGAISLMAERKAYDLYAKQNDTVVTTNMRSLLTIHDPSKDTLNNVMSSCRYLQTDDSLEKACKIMTHYRIRSVPVVDGDKIVAELRASDIIRHLRSKGLHNVGANSIMTPEPVTLDKKDSISKARQIMIDQRIDHLPVMDGQKVVSVVTSSHLVSLLLPREGIGKKAIGADPQKRFSSQIGNIGNSRVPILDANATLPSVIDSMLETESTCCLIELWDKIHGIITYGDILSLLGTEIPSMVPLYIVGLPDNHPDAKIIKDKLSGILGQLLKGYPSIEEARAVIKTSHKQGKRQHYDVKVCIFSPYKTTNYTESGWDLSKTFDILGKRMMKVLS